MAVSKQLSILFIYQSTPKTQRFILQNLRYDTLYNIYNYICLKSSLMDKSQDNAQPVGKYWIIFAISMIVQIIFFVWIREYFWLILPWIITSFSKAMRII